MTNRNITFEDIANEYRSTGQNMRSDEAEMIVKIRALMDSVILRFKEGNLIKELYKWFSLVSSGDFHVRHISLLLMYDVVNFLSEKNSTQMRYKWKGTMFFITSHFNNGLLSTY